MFEELIAAGVGVVVLTGGGAAVVLMTSSANVGKKKHQG